MTLGEMLRVRRVSRQVRQLDAALELGIGLRTYQAWEGGERAPGATRWGQLAGWLDVSRAQVALGVAAWEAPAEVDYTVQEEL